MEEAEAVGTGFGAIGCVVGLIAGVVFGLVGWAIGKGKGQGGLGFILGFFLGIIGIIIIGCIGGRSSGGGAPRRWSHRALKTQGKFRPRGRR